MTRKRLTNESFGILIRAGRVESISLCYSEANQDWWLFVSHADAELSADLHTERGSQRRFKTSDTALHLLHKLGYQGPLRFDYLSADEVAAA